jgi:hypothetical protein
MATVIYQAPTGASIGIFNSSGTLWRIRPNELFGMNTADSAQTEAFLAAGFDYTTHTAYTTGSPSVLTTDPDKAHAHNPYGLTVDPP